MAEKDIATLKLSIDQDELRRIISEGRLPQFINSAAVLAAEQINQQLVQHIAEGAIQPRALSSGMSVDFSYRSVLIDGEPGFGTHPPLPHGPRVNLVVNPE